MNLSQLTSGADLQRNYEWEYASSDMFRVQALSCCRTTIHSPVRQMYIGWFCVRIISILIIWHSLWEMTIPCMKARNFHTSLSTASEKYFRPRTAIWFRVVRMHPTPFRSSETFNWSQNSWFNSNFKVVYVFLFTLSVMDNYHCTKAKDFSSEI